jgi:hypothetical protein
MITYATSVIFCPLFQSGQNRKGMQNIPEVILQTFSVAGTLEETKKRQPERPPPVSF